jgi:D-sedoheptulose 7-phosphate isomerase
MERAQHIRQHFEDAQQVLRDFLEQGTHLDALEKAGNLMAESISSGGKVISCGNGGSMCDAMHFAEELTGRYRDDRRALPAVSISDPSHLTCVGNDYGFDAVFARYVQAMGQSGDVLLAISTSGNSPNVIKAAEAAREQGLAVVGLTGKDGGSLAKLCHAEIRVPWNGHADRIQEVHIKCIHALIDHIEAHCA